MNLHDIREILDAREKKKLAQRQDSLNDQLKDLADTAVILGMNDAADFIRNCLLVSKEERFKQLGKFFDENSSVSF